jgi:hypothetical protein
VRGQAGKGCTSCTQLLHKLIIPDPNMVVRHPHNCLLQLLLQRRQQQLHIIPSCMKLL